MEPTRRKVPEERSGGGGLRRVGDPAQKKKKKKKKKTRRQPNQARESLPIGCPQRDPSTIWEGINSPTVKPLTGGTGRRATAWRDATKPSRGVCSIGASWTDDSFSASLDQTGGDVAQPHGAERSEREGARPRPPRGSPSTMRGIPHQSPRHVLGRSQQLTERRAVWQKWAAAQCRGMPRRSACPGSFGSPGNSTWNPCSTTSRRSPVTRMAAMMFRVPVAMLSGPRKPPRVDTTASVPSIVRATASGSSASPRTTSAPLEKRRHGPGQALEPGGHSGSPSGPPPPRPTPSLRRLRVA